MKQIRKWLGQKNQTVCEDDFIINTLFVDCFCKSSSSTTAVTLIEHLYGGVRCFDIRVTGINGKLHTSMGSLAWVFDTIRRRGWENTVLPIILFFDTHGLDEKDLKQFEKTLLKYLGHHLCCKLDGSETLSDLRSKALVYTRDPLLSSRTGINPSKILHIPSTYEFSNTEFAEWNTKGITHVYQNSTPYNIDSFLAQGCQFVCVDYPTDSPTLALLFPEHYGFVPRSTYDLVIDLKNETIV